MLALDGRLDLASMAMLLVLSAAIAGLWWPAGWNAVASTLSVAAFNWAFVPPRHSFNVDVQQHAVLLVAMLVVNAIIGAAMFRLRRLADTAALASQRAAQLRHWGDALREAADPVTHASALQAALAESAGVPVALRLALRTHPQPTADAVEGHWQLLGEPSADQRAGLALCTREGRALGPGTGRHDEQPDLYLPLRGRGQALGAAVLCGVQDRGRDLPLREHLQALCDQWGSAQHRALVDREEQRTRQQAEQQAARNALLAAISHDFRTPLATMLGAATSLQQQADRLSPAQRRRLADTLVDEIGHLGRLTDNTLQLARLGGPAVALAGDWESVEDIVGSVTRHARRRAQGDRLRVRLEPGLPLLHCDALLVVQLLDNLIDNALKYSPADQPVELLVRRIGAHAVLAVRDRGPGIAPAWRERVFTVFQRGEAAGQEGKHATGTLAEASTSAVSGPATDLAQHRPGAGVGLAVCRAIAQAHGGELRLRARAHGGCAFECWLPLKAEPPLPPAQEAAG